MNMLLDLLTSAMLIRLVSRLFSRQAGLIAGVLWVFAPALIWSDYLIRMYTLLALCITGSVWCLFEAVRPTRNQYRFHMQQPIGSPSPFAERGAGGEVKWLIASAAFALAGLYTHS